MNLSKVIEGVEIQSFYGTKDIVIKGIAYDSRKVKKDYIFVCIKGLKTDGHNFINDSIKNGAKVIIIEKDIHNLELIKQQVSIIKVKDSRLVLSKISDNFYGNPSHKLKIIGITGTNGKTSITYLTNTLLESNGIKCGLLGTINNRIGDKIINTSRTTPEAPELHSLFKKMIEANVEVCTMEVSSHALDLFRVEDVAFNIGIFTNLTPDHLDYHENMEEYKNAKIKLFYKTSDINIINIDDKYGKEIYDSIKELNTPLLSYSIKEKSDIYATNIEMESTYSTFTLVTPKFSGKVRLNIPGLFSIYNLLASISVCYSLGFDFSMIKNGIASIKPVKGRFETVTNNKGLNIIVDYAHTPDALENVLNTIKQFAKNRIIVVFGCGGDRDRTKRPVMGKVASSLSDICIITNDNPRTEDPNQIIKDILKGIDVKKSNYKIIMDRREAIKKAINIAEKGDFILIAGKGHETYQIIGDKTYEFDDTEVAKSFL